MSSYKCLKFLLLTIICPVIWLNVMYREHGAWVVITSKALKRSQAFEVRFGASVPKASPPLRACSKCGVESKKRNRLSPKMMFLNQNLRIWVFPISHIPPGYTKYAHKRWQTCAIFSQHILIFHKHSLPNNIIHKLMLIFISSPVTIFVYVCMCV